MPGHTTDLTSQPYSIPLTSCRVWDAIITGLPGTAADDDMGLVTGTPGTHAPVLKGVDFGGTSTDEACAFQWVVPQEYDAAATLKIRLKAGMLTAISDGTATVDVLCWPDAGDGTVSADICATAAQSINSLTLANKDFTLTATNLVGGTLLNFKLVFGGSDVGNAAVMIPTITSITMLVDINPLAG